MPKFSACRSPWIQTREVRSSARVVQVGDVGVEEGGAAPVEGEGVGGHRAELGPEGGRARGHEVGEGVGEGVDDAARPLLGVMGAE